MFSFKVKFHNIIQIHNNVLWDWQYSTRYYRMWEIYGNILWNFPTPHKIVMDLNNVMIATT